MTGASVLGKRGGLVERLGALERTKAGAKTGEMSWIVSSDKSVSIDVAVSLWWTASQMLHKPDTELLARRTSAMPRLQKMREFLLELYCARAEVL